MVQENSSYAANIIFLQKAQMSREKSQVYTKKRKFTRTLYPANQEREALVADSLKLECRKHQYDMKHYTLK